jgi:hypothetical protein
MYSLLDMGCTSSRAIVQASKVSGNPFRPPRANVASLGANQGRNSQASRKTVA